VSQQQQVFELRNVEGTLVGFRLPQFFKDLNVSGYHFHLITSDRKRGGHLIDGEFLNTVADVETLRNWQTLLPSNSAFGKAPLQ
jgi:acetolactate decarboxylase